MKKILLSLLVVGAVVGAGVYATNAFFSDTETSTGNQFIAGDIDLQIDNESYALDYNIPGFSSPAGAFVASAATSWSLKDLVPGVDHFFNFSDLKPGDYGEDTISIHVGSNNAWMCAAARLTDNSDQSCTEPEMADDPSCTTPGLNQGDLASQLNFMFWHDDGDNVLEVGETPFINGPLSGLGTQGQIRLADSAGSILGANTPIPGNTTFYIGKAWCYGTLSAGTVPQDNSGKTGSNGPTSGRGTGVLCNGSSLNNAGQTDRVQGDLQFYAVQSRNNAQFTCAANYQPTWPNVEEVRPSTGALLSAYAAPVTCDVIVDDSVAGPFDTIQEGVNAATAGQTVCVKAGTYTENVNVNKSLTLAGDGSSLVTLTGVGTGEAGALVVTADNVTVKGFKVIGTGVSALRVSNPHNGVTFSYNHAVAAAGQNALLMDGGQTNHTVSSNLFEGASSQLAYVNGLASVNVASTNVDFISNTFAGTGNMALGQEAGGSDVKLNKFSAVTSFTDVEDWEGGNLYNQNNFNDAGLNLQHSENGNTGDNGITNAENNWWGDNNPADGDANANVDVDFTPFEASAFPEN